MADQSWIDKGEYWVTDAEQMSEFWHAARSCRVTGSKIGGLVGHSIFSDPGKTAREIAGVFNPSITSYKENMMKDGIVMEPYAREWYAGVIGKHITEMGLAVPKWDVRFGTSVDGIISDTAICEIKVPHKMYSLLIDHRKRMSNGEKFDKYYHAHIWDTHYDQMQLGMVVTNTRMCHYVVYMPSKDPSIPKDVYCEIVHFNPNYWELLYSDAGGKYEELIIPIMKEYGLSRVDPPK